MRRAAAGFTLLEMMIVIAILGVVASIAFPSFTYLTSSNRVKSTSTELYLGLIRARNEAVKRNRLVTLRRNASGWAQGWQVVADQDNNGSFDDSGDRVINDMGAQNRVSITANVSSVVFLASGRVQGSSPAIEIVSLDKPDMKRCISADLTGKPYTKEGACS